MSEQLTAERLRELLHYDPETGVFTWRVNLRGGGAVAGSEAGGAHAEGYRQVGVSGRLYLAHRLAWLYTHGVWPSADLDHRDGDRSNNRLSNLRSATRAENHQNRAIQRNNTSGYTGVTWVVGSQAWRAQIKVSRRFRYLGYFGTPEEAHAAYLAAKRQLHTFQPIPRTTTTGTST